MASTRPARRRRASPCSRTSSRCTRSAATSAALTQATPAGGEPQAPAEARAATPCDGGAQLAGRDPARAQLLERGCQLRRPHRAGRDHHRQRLAGVSRRPSAPPARPARSRAPARRSPPGPPPARPACPAASPAGRPWRRRRPAGRPGRRREPATTRPGRRAHGCQPSSDTTSTSSCGIRRTRRAAIAAARTGASRPPRWGRRSSPGSRQRAGASSPGRRWGSGRRPPAPSRPSGSVTSTAVPSSVSSTSMLAIAISLSTVGERPAEGEVSLPTAAPALEHRACRSRAVPRRRSPGSPCGA